MAKYDDNRPENEQIDEEFEFDEELDINEWPEESKEETYKENKFRKFMVSFVSIILVLSLVGATFAVFPQIFNLASFNFVKDSVVLSQQNDIQEYKKSVVIVKTESGKGTGFFYGQGNTIVTNQHIINDANKIEIITNNGKLFIGKLVTSDPKIDYAIIRIDSAVDQFPVFKAATDVDVDDGLYIIGNPLFNSFIASNGLFLEVINRIEINNLVIGGKFYKGNSGSPILNKDGEVLGILYATTKVVVDGKEIDAALAVPINYVNTALDALKNGS